MTYYVGPEGPRDATLAIVAEKGAAEEIAQGRPLVGTTGRAVDEHLRKIGTRRERVWLTNAVQTFDSIGNPSTADIKRERLRLYRELAGLPNLRCVVAMGNASLLSLSNFHHADITRRRGSILRSFIGVKMVPTLHPSFYMRGEWRYKPVVEFDLARALAESQTPDLDLPVRTFYLEPTLQDVLEWCHALEGAKYISFDIETSRPAWISCIGFSDDPSRAYCIPILRGTRKPYWSPREEVQVWRAIQRVLSQPNTCYITQNGLFDCFHLWRHGIETPYMRTGFDTMYAHRQIAPDLPHALHFLTSIYTREPYYKDESGRWDAQERVPDPQFWTYNCKDASVTLEVALAEMEDMREMGMLDYYLQYRQPKFDPLLSMRKIGIRVDVERLAAVRDRLQSERQMAEQQLCKEYGEIPNTKSYLDMGRLFKTVGVSYHTTPTGRPKSDEDAMVQYIHRAVVDGNQKAQTVLGLCLEVTEKRTLQSGFTNIALDRSGFYHPVYDLSKAVTGRDQSEGCPEGGPQLMNIPKPIRVVFVADQPDYCVVQADLKTAEARVSAWEAEDLFAIAAFEGGKDIYRANACKIYRSWSDPMKLPPDDLMAGISPVERQAAKVATLAFDYKMGARKFVAVQAKAGNHFTEAEAKRLRGIIISPAKARWHETVAEQLRKTRWLTNAFGLKREFYGIFDEDMVRAGLSWLAQSTVAHIDSCAKIALETELPRLGARLMTTTHDSATVSCPTDRKEEVCRILQLVYKRPMVIHNRSLLIPLDITSGPSWGEQG